MQTRPKEIIDWGHQRESAPSIASVDDFRQRWIVWWGGCQPKWRSIGTWPYTRGDAKDKDWDRINVTGPHGLFTVIMSASWWAGSGSSRDAVSPAIEDLHWVFENLVDFNSRSQNTRPKPVVIPPSNFPGHREREAGKRKIKPTHKAIGNP